MNDQYELDDDAELDATMMLSPDAMSAPDQHEIQQLHTDLAAANERGDEQAAADIQSRLDAKLTGK